MVNGQREPTITMRPGGAQRWRILPRGLAGRYVSRAGKHELHAIARTAFRWQRWG